MIISVLKFFSVNLHISVKFKTFHIKGKLLRIILSIFLMTVSRITSFEQFILIDIDTWTPYVSVLYSLRPLFKHLSCYAIISEFYVIFIREISS